MAHSIHFDGVDLAGSNYGVTLLDGEYPLLPSARLEVRSLGTRHGGYSQGGYLEPREIAAPISVRGTSNDDLDDKLDALRLLMNPRNGDKSIKFDHQADRYYLGRLNEAVNWKYYGPCVARAVLHFLCADPLAYSTTETTQTITVTETPYDTTAPSVGVVAGTEYARPVWTVKNTGVSSVPWVEIWNTTTNELIRSKQSIAHNAYVRFDSERERLQKSSDGTNWEDIMLKIDEFKQFPRLAPGVSNSVQIGGLASGVVTVKYRARFL